MLNDSGSVLIEYAPVLASPSFGFLGGVSAVGIATSAAHSDVPGELPDYAERNGD